MYKEILQSTTFRVPQQAYLASDHVSPAIGKTIAVTISKNGAAYGNPSGGATNSTGIGSGSYYVDLSTTDTATLGPLFVLGTEGTIDNVVAIFMVVKATNGGLTGIPDAVAGANTGLPTVDASNNVHGLQTGVTVSTNSDKTGYTLSSAGIQAVWDFATSLLSTVGSIGKLLVDNINATITSRLASASYTAPLDAAGTRTAVGLASANLDTQFTAIPAAILDLSAGVEAGFTVRQLLRLQLAAICGPRSAFSTNSPIVKNPAGTKNRLAGTITDTDGDGTWVTDVT